jgi:hypothetical protein
MTPHRPHRDYETAGARALSMVVCQPDRAVTGDQLTAQMLPGAG